MSYVSEEEKILAFIKKRNDEGIKLQFELYFDELFRYCYSLINHKEDSEDIVQIIFIDLWEKGYKRDIKSLKSYLFTALKYRVYSYWTKKETITDLVDEFNEILVSYELNETLENKELENSIYSAIKLLPPACKKIFELSRFEDLSHDEIAQRLNISKQTVKNQINSAVKFIRVHLSMS